MMIKKLIIILSFITIMVFPAAELRAEVNPRVKALGVMAIYGAVGGALLGTASMAFGAGGRSIAKGASIGLYAGLLFGGYVVTSHYIKKRKASGAGDSDYYPDTNVEANPYEQTYIDNTEHDQSHTQQMKVDLISFSKEEIKAEKVYYMNLVNIQF